MGTTPWSNDTPRNLIIPGNAGPDDPRIVIGPDVPPAILAKYAAFDLVSTAWIGEYINGTTYFYTVWGKSTAGFPTALWFFGIVNGATVKEFHSASGRLSDTTTALNYGALDRIGSVQWLGPGTFDPLNPLSYNITDFQFNIGGEPEEGPTESEALLYGTSIGRGLQDSNFSTATSVTVASGASGEVMNVAITLFPGRAYRIQFGNRIESSIAGGIGRPSLKRSDVTGVEIADFGDISMANATADYPCAGSAYVRNTTAAVITDVVSLCLQNLGASGTIDMPSNAAADGPRYLAVEDAGAASDFTFAPQW